jgi:hypothetical protein
MEEGERLPELRAGLVRRGYERAADFSPLRVWTACAEAYRRAISIGVP